MKHILIFVLFLLLVSSCQENLPRQKIMEGDCQDSGTCVSDNISENNSNVDLFSQDLSSVYSEEVEGKVNGFLAKPNQPGNYPGIMIHEWWGLNENIKEMAKILAKEGYIVFAIDLYDGEVASNSTRAGQLATGVRNNQDKAVEKMKDAVKYLKDTENAAKIGSLGWCFGGGESLQLSLNEKLDATVIYYGSLVTDKEQLKKITWPVLGVFGDKDQSIPVSSVQEFQSALGELKIENEVYIYPGVGHAFANPSGANYAKDETIDAWEKTIDFLNRQLKNQ